MTTLAISPPPLRRLFRRIDFAPQPRSEHLARLLEYWRESRGERIAPRREDINKAEIGDASTQMFIYEAERPRDYTLAMGRQAAGAVLEAAEVGEGLTQAKNRRVAVRLRRLFDCVGEAGEPVVAEFALPGKEEGAFVEVLAAPLGAQASGKTAIFGGLALHAPAPHAHLAAHHGRFRGPTGPLVFSLGDSRAFGEAVGRHLGVSLAPHEERDFEDGEHKTRPLTSVRSRDVYVIANLAGDSRESANDRLVKFLFFIAGVKDASAARVTAVVPYLSYARKDRQTKSRDPVTTRYVAQLFEAVGTDRLITMEAHNLAAFQNAFRCDTDHLDANLLFARHFAALVGNKPVAVVSPDLGGVKRAEFLRERLEALLGRSVGKGFMDKQRSMGKVTGDIFAGEVGGATVVIPDDLISTGTTMARVAAACRERGAKEIHLAATHALFSGGAPALFAAPGIASIVVTDTVSPLRVDPAEAGGRLAVLSVAHLFAEAIQRSHAGGSIVDLLDRGA
jgi:ribose-phosphate pyrophosphokinase